MLAQNSVILSSSSSQYFADLLARKLQIPQVPMERKTFSGGEQYMRIGSNNRFALTGQNVIYVASTHTDADIEEMYSAGCALAAGNGTQQRIFVVPFLGYSTMERAVKANEVVKLKTLARKLSAIPNTRLGNSFLFLDLHVSGTVHYFEGDCYRTELYAEKPLTVVIDKLVADYALTDFVFASADLGRPKWVETFAARYGVELALIRKKRDGENTDVLQVFGDVHGKWVVIYDDMIRSADTLIKAAKAYLKAGAVGVLAVCSHMALNNIEVIGRILDSPIQKVVFTNSHPMSQSPALSTYFDRFEVVDVSDEYIQPIQQLLGIQV